jgi:uncharacterized damage-inducible protein DinB
MEHHLDHTISLLTRTPATLQALLHGLPETWTLQNEGPGTWNVASVLGHLSHCERTDWMPRVKIILQPGDNHIFEPLDRQAHLAKTQGKSLDQLLAEFAHLRTQSLHQLQALHLSPENLTLRGNHPAFGPVTLSELLATWASHDLTHLHQISRIMAHQYRDLVGPWKAYLGVLHCDGHSGS